MAVETIKQITQPPEFLEAEAKLYLDQLRPAIAGIAGADLSQVYGPQFVAGMDPLTQQAMGQAAGLGSYAPFLQQAEALTGPTAYQQYMSPYQQDVIDTTLREFDIQTQKGLPQLAQQAISAGAFGGGREGVQRAELQRGILSQIGQAQQAGFGQALAAAQQQRAQQLATGQALGQLGAQQQAMSLADIQAQMQAGALQRGIGQQALEAQRQTALQRAYEPYQRIEFLKGIMTNLPTTQSTLTATTAPGSNPLGQALGAGLGAYSTYNLMQNR